MTAVTHDHDAPYQPVFVGERRKELDALFPLYPTKMACILPALWMVQEDRGWISDEGMAEVAEDMVARVAVIIEERDVDEAEAVRKDDEEMDRLRRSTFAELFGSEWTAGVEAAVDLALLGRYYERIADHAVAVAGRVVFVVTGEAPIAS